jgi:hypothetical protein
MIGPTTLFCHFVLVLLPASAGAAFHSRHDVNNQKAQKVIPAAEVRNHVGQECTALMKVKASKDAAPRRTYFLDSEEDFHDRDNLSVVISYDHALKFREAGIDNPAEHYKDRTVRVTGKVIEEDEQIRIRVEDPKNIEIVESK